jgi:hypothetical protein
MTENSAGVGPVERVVRHAAQTRGSLAFWGNLMIAQAWAAACYVRPGWFPAAMSLASFLLAALSLYKGGLTAEIAARADDEHA